MSLIMTFVASTLAALIGTFLANFGLLWLISKQAEAAEKERQKKLLEVQQIAREMIKADIRKKQEYIKMES